MVTLTRWRLDRSMAIWGLAFGAAATVSGMLVLSSLRGGFIAEGFFLLVISWVLYVVLIARVVKRVREGRPKDDLEE